MPDGNFAPTRTLRDAGDEYILQVLEATRGNKSQACRILAIDKRTLYRRLKAMGKASGGKRAVR